MPTGSSESQDIHTPATSITGSARFTPETDPTVIGDLWDGRRFAIPWPGNQYNIIEKSSGRALIVGEGGWIVLKDIGEDDNPIHRWLCVEKNGYFGFTNVQTGKYIGHDNMDGLGAWAAHHEAWELLTPRRHPDGGYELLVPHWWHTLKMMCVHENGSGVVLRQNGTTTWEFVKV